MSEEATGAERNVGGRPSKFEDRFIEQARKLSLLGATDREIADFFEIDVATLYRWKHDKPGFCDAIKVGKEEADNRVERSLYNRAIGYTFESEKVFNYQGVIVRAPVVEHVPPETTAGIFWLKNRKPGEWRDKVDHEHAGKDGAAIELNVTNRDRAKAVAALVAKATKP